MNNLVSYGLISASTAVAITVAGNILGSKMVEVLNMVSSALDTAMMGF